MNEELILTLMAVVYSGTMLEDTVDYGMILFGIARGLAIKYGEIYALEIGVRQGGTTLPILVGLKSVKPGGHLISIDNDKDSPGMYHTALKNVRMLELEWHFEIADSATYVPPDHEYHMIFVDADHSYEAVKRDFERFSPYLAKDGLMLFHDTETDLGSRRALREVAELPEWDVVTIPFSHGLSIARRK